ncbi:hypothetical protein BSPWISOXPB_4264 [uncultured Gammaproteobacteria bacterium]|nr:hypothetical protein BSPWISOXPB_4264 [uncultured Gammaproteobacteria bacterium]
MNKKREKALEGLTRIAQVIISDKYHDESIEVLLCSKAIERIVILKGQYLPKTHKDTVLSMSISDDEIMMVQILFGYTLFMKKNKMEAINNG